MATEPTLTTIDALKALAPIVGAGGISGIVIAVLGYLKAARDGRPTPTVGAAGQVGIATLYAEQASLTQASAALTALSVAIERLAHAVETLDGEKVEKMIDEFRDLRRAIEDAAADLGRRA